MYSEKTFKNYIFWIQVKRVLLIIIISCLGAGIGIGIGAILKGTAGIDSYNNFIIIGLTVIFFLISLIITAGTGKEVQDGYWKMAVLRKLTAIQKTLEGNTEALSKEDLLKIETASNEALEVQKTKPNSVRKRLPKTIKAPSK